MSKIFNSQIVSSKGIQNEKLEQCKDKKDCSCSFCALSNFNGIFIFNCFFSFFK